MTRCLPQARDDCQAAAAALADYCDSVLDATAVGPADSELDRWTVEAAFSRRPGPPAADLQCAFGLQIDDVTRDAAAVQVRYVR